MTFPKDFEEAVELALRHEGGYVNHPKDPGGETNYGVTAKALKEFNIRQLYDWTVPTLTKDQAKRFYYEMYWVPMRLSEVRYQTVKNVLLGCAINMGIKPAVRKMQNILELNFDGVLGPQTIGKINATDSTWVVSKYCQLIEGFYVFLAVRRPALKVFLKGWLNRINSYRVA